MTLDHPWTEPPAPADIREVAPGIFWLRMPLPFQLNHINLWLLEDGPGWTIVDTGVGLDDTRALWERIFATHLDGRPVRRVLVAQRQRGRLRAAPRAFPPPRLRPRGARAARAPGQSLSDARARGDDGVPSHR